ncbi:hypothetical protein GNX71_18580 [Variovorax sp. RKNM96]|uniref:phage nozzle protein n=1 Tax=Variovorax sp. RKNM96 TaxID=2681552 RepID=UPI00197DB053|nr:hypothetical protein [Variovorax sp. RKNM96]QSI31475.1 hypothetical protein GNX71_18580 [Variovorax sp. RKNM96]
MSLISRAIPGLFGGVSQQIPAMRHPTHCDFQENALSTLVDGLYKRPGTRSIANNLGVEWATGSGSSGNCVVHVIDRPGTNPHGVILTGDETTPLVITDMVTGASETVTFPEGGKSYLASSDPENSFRCVTVADSTFLVNTGVTVTALGGDGLTWPETVNFVYVKSAPASQLYAVVLTGFGTASMATGAAFSNITSLTASIIDQLNLISGVTAAQSYTTGLIEIHTTGPSVCYVADSFNNTTMVSLRTGVDKYTDLPTSHPEGYRVRVAGDIKNEPYLVEFKTADDRWVETRDYGISRGFNPATMPMKLVPVGGGWECRPIAYDERLVGTDKSNPQPSFVGKTIRDLFFYRNRLWFLAGDSCASSRAGTYYNFFAASTVNVLDTDPIDIGSAVASVHTLDHAVPFNEDMTIWASTKQQFTLKGGDTLTPSTARLVPSTSFETDGTVSPKTMGNKIVYPFRAKGSSQFGLYRAARDLVSNTVESITDHVPTYMPERVQAIEASDSFKAVLVKHIRGSSSLHVFKYEDDGEKMTQRAWQSFKFDSTMQPVKCHWSGSRLYMFMNRIGFTSTKDRLTLAYIELDPTIFDDQASHPILLDGRQYAMTASASGGNTTLTFDGRHDISKLVIFGSLGGYTTQYTVISSSLSSTQTSLSIKGLVPVGTIVSMGYRYTMAYRFTEVLLKDKDGVPIMSAKLKLLKILLNYKNTSTFKATVEIAKSGTYSYEFNSEGVGTIGQLLGTTTNLVSGAFSIPVQAPAQDAVITITSDSWRPVCFPYAEWKGNVNMSAKR